MTPDHLDQIAKAVQDSLLNSLDREVQSAAEHLGITEEISDDDWHRGMEFYLLNVVRIARLVTPVVYKLMPPAVAG